MTGIGLWNMEHLPELLALGVLLDLLACLFVGWVASRRGRVGLAWFVISLLVTPLLALLGLFVFTRPPRNDP